VPKNTKDADNTVMTRIGPAADSPHPLYESAEPDRKDAPLSGAVGRLTMVQVFGAATALVTGPLQARALGVEGRGELAAVTVPLTLLPLLTNMGLGVYVSRAAARGATRGTLTASVGGMLIVIGLLGALAAYPLAALLGHRSGTVETFLRVGFLCAPLYLFGYFLWALNQGLERWSALVWYRLVWPLFGTAAIVCLYAVDALTLATACSVFITCSLLSIVPLLGVLRGVGELRLEAGMTREALVFGLPAWIGLLAYHANISLDQLLMIPLVDSRQLGLYAVAATLAYYSTTITGPLQVAIVPRSARGDRELVIRAFRSITWLIGALSIAIAGAAPVLVPLLFGSAFSDAVPMAWILLVAGLPLTGTMVLGAALSAAGRPGSPARGELVALAVMVPALFIFLPRSGGIAAAIISLIGYSINFTVQLRAARRVFGGSLSSYLVLRGADVRWLRERIRAGIRALQPRSARSP
jgi:O-antigen/teichoic acid export membrane protein